MVRGETKIGVVATGSRIEPALASRVNDLVTGLYPDGSVKIHFHPQCFLASGHFAGADSIRAEAFLEIANDPGFDALWFARGGYGACRLAELILSALTDTARNKTYLGYSDAGSLLAGLYASGFEGVAHGPMPVDLIREGGERAVERSLRYLVEGAVDSLEPTVSPHRKTAAFNISILSQLLGTSLQPDLTGHILMLEETGEHMYRIDRAFFHITSNPAIRRVAGIMLGGCSNILPNHVEFGQNEEEIAQHWCAVSGVPYLGRAQIGHDIDNRVVPFGQLRKRG